MSNLKELTWEHHKNAERQQFVKLMFSGNISQELYATYLFNQFAIYNLLEEIATMNGLLDTIPEVRRAPKILEDFKELWKSKKNPKLCKSTENYINYLKNIIEDKNKLMAHIYVRHMGDLSGGQMLSKKVPGSGNYYKFDTEVNNLKNRIRSMLDDSMAEEAKICFDFATTLFKELGDIHEHDLDKTN